jgi:hypothetical protein
MCMKDSPIETAASEKQGIYGEYWSKGHAAANFLGVRCAAGM